MSLTAHSWLGAPARSTPTLQEFIERIAIRLGRHEQEEKEERQPGNDVLMKWIQRIVQEVTERNDDQDPSEEPIAQRAPPPEQDERASREFHERDRESDSPQGPEG